MSKSLTSEQGREKRWSLIEIFLTGQPLKSTTSSTCAVDKSSSAEKKSQFEISTHSIPVVEVYNFSHSISKGNQFHWVEWLLILLPSEDSTMESVRRSVRSTSWRPTSGLLFLLSTLLGSDVAVLFSTQRELSDSVEDQTEIQISTQLKVSNQRSRRSGRLCHSILQSLKLTI